MDIDDPRVEEALAEMSAALAKTDDPALVRAFLKQLFTPSEAVDIAVRWALVKSLKEKQPQREIARQFGISLCKITRGSRELKKPDSAFQKMLNTDI
jgi:TrpR family trp operon transcriptional repressor